MQFHRVFFWPMHSALTNRRPAKSNECSVGQVKTLPISHIHTQMGLCRLGRERWDFRRLDAATLIHKANSPITILIAARTKKNPSCTPHWLSMCADRKRRSQPDFQGTQDVLLAFLVFYDAFELILGLPNACAARTLAQLPSTYIRAVHQTSPKSIG